MWVITTNNEMINVAHADRIELLQRTAEVAGTAVTPNPSGRLTGISIIAHLAGQTEPAELAFILAADNYDLLVTRYWNALRTAIKSRAELCDLMDIA